MLIKLNKICTVIFATLLCFMIAGLDVTTSQKMMVNSALKAKTYKIIDDPNDETDAIYFKASYDPQIDGDKQRLSDYADDVAERVMGEGMVLLRNDNNALPLKHGDNISLFGQGAIKPGYNTAGSSAASDEGYDTFKQAFSQQGLSINNVLWDRMSYLYSRSGFGRARSQNGYEMRDASWADQSDAVSNSIGSYGDAAIVVLSRSSGEGRDLNTQGSDTISGRYLDLTQSEEDMLKALTVYKEAGTVKKIIVLLNGSMPMELEFMFRSDINVDACMWIGNMGRAGIRAVAKAIVGKINPSGRVGDTFTRDSISSPAMASWMHNSTRGASEDIWFSETYSNPNLFNLTQVNKYFGVYLEGIYNGYRYYETRYEDYVMNTDNTGAFNYKKDVAFPFGYGLSYTSFEYNNFKVTQSGDEFTVTLTVKNTGNVTGKDVVQIYLQKPYSEYDKSMKIEKASVELVGFAKTDMLRSNGGQEQVSIKVDKEAFKSYDAEGYKTYILSEGKYYLSAGKDAHNALNNILATKNYTPEGTEQRMDDHGNVALAEMVWDNPALDAVKYAKATETGYAITNQLDFVDINRYENRGTNEVTYLSRSDWEGTWPKTRASIYVNAEMFADLQSNKPIIEVDLDPVKYGEQKGLSIAMMRGLAYDATAWQDLLDQMSFVEQADLVMSLGALIMMVLLRCFRLKQVRLFPVREFGHQHLI